jgi:hypothetical protein
LFKNLTVEGYDFGVWSIVSQVSLTFENLTPRAQAATRSSPGTGAAGGEALAGAAAGADSAPRRGPGTRLVWRSSIVPMLTASTAHSAQRIAIGAGELHQPAVGLRAFSMRHIA